MKSSQAPKTLIIVLLTLGILCGVAAVVLLGGSLGGVLENLRDGQEVSCTALVNAPVFGSNLVFSTPPTCQKLGSCFVNPAKGLSITGITGDIGLWQSGVLYSTEDVDQSRFASAKTYTITACIPQDASQVRIGIITETGGVVNDQPITIN